jgi:FMNH2-dependent dimethyl sulfone monooxygenase
MVAGRPDSPGESPLARMRRQPVILGLFLPTQSGGWTPSSAPRGTDWTYEYSVSLARQAERAGFDLVFALAQWLGAGGWGGRTRYREMSLDPLMVTAGMAQATERMALISTVHVLYGWHPVQLAKLGATLDHMSRGRWGLNVVTGYFPDEIRMFGGRQPPHDERYSMAAEFTAMMERLWEADGNLSEAGQYWSMEEAFVSPKPIHGRPIMVNAGGSEAGLCYAARHSDFIFITSPGGADIGDALATLPAHIQHIKALASEYGREVSTIINPHIICRETEAEVQQIRRTIIEGEDVAAVDNLSRGFAAGDQTAWRGHRREQRIIGGNVHVFGTPEHVVAQLVQLKQAGCDGFQLNFFDFQPDLTFFVERVLPLMREAGLRIE